MRSLPPHVSRAREPVLDKVLSHLPDELLSALAYGLERHAGRLVAGQLYDDYDGGGCAVGVMLRELSPSDYRQGRLQFRARRHRHRSILTERVDLDPALVTRLSHVEMCFDRTTRSLCEELEEADLRVAANATGRWVAEGCREQLRARSRSGARGFFVPLEWSAKTTGPRPRRHRAPHVDPVRANQAARRTCSATVRNPPPALHLPSSIRRLTADTGDVTLVSVEGSRRHASQAPLPLSITTRRRLSTPAGALAVVTAQIGPAVPEPVETVIPDAVAARAPELILA